MKFKLTANVLRLAALMWCVSLAPLSGCFLFPEEPPGDGDGDGGSPLADGGDNDGGSPLVDGGDSGTVVPPDGGSPAADAGPPVEDGGEQDGGRAHADGGESDGGVMSPDGGVMARVISPGFSEVVLLDPQTGTPFEGNSEELLVEADEVSTHMVRVIVRDQNNLPIAGASVTAEPVENGSYLQLMSCGVSSPGTTDVAGQMICQVSSRLAETFQLVVSAQLDNEETHVLEDDIQIAFDRCLDARAYYIREVMGPIFTTCLGCHNEYGLAQDPSSGWLTWTGKLEGSPGFIEANLTTIGAYGATGSFDATEYGVDALVPYFLAKPAGLVPPEPGDDPAVKPMGHGGGQVLMPGAADDPAAEDFHRMWSLLQRLEDEKSCPQESEYLFYNPFIAEETYSDAELFHRATFTLTGQFPPPEEYASILETGATSSGFSKDDLVQKLNPDPTFSTGGDNGGPTASSSGGGNLAEDGDAYKSDPITTRPAFYERMSEVIEDLLHIEEKPLGQVDNLFFLSSNLAINRWRTFKPKYIQGSHIFSCRPQIDFDYASVCSGTGNGLSPDECVTYYGCCEDIGNHDVYSDQIPGAPQCGQYTDANTCEETNGCYVETHSDTFASLGQNIIDPLTGDIVDWSLSGAGLRLVNEGEAASSTDVEYGFCYAYQTNSGEERKRCYLDSDMSWADDHGFWDGADIFIPEGTPLLMKYPRYLELQGNGSIKPIARTNYSVPVPFECRHVFCSNGDQWSNEDMGEVPNRLAHYILQNPEDPDFNNDFRSILTSAHLVLNPYVAFLMGYDVTDGTFEDPLNRDEWVKLESIQGPGNRYGLPDANYGENQIEPTHAGWLTTPQMLSRYRTTQTNYNRARSKEVYDKFLAVDIMDFSNVEVDPNTPLPENPTMDGFSCRICHAAMDPLGGHYQNYSWPSRASQYDPDFTNLGHWVSGPECDNKGINEECLRPPSYKGELLEDYGDPAASLLALGEQMTNDERFGLAIVRWLHEALIGLSPLKPPRDPFHPDYYAQVDAYIAQYHEFERVRQEFVDSGYDLRGAIEAIITGPIYNIKTASASSDFEETVYRYAGVGAGQRLPPEQLRRKIIDTTGFPWYREFAATQSPIFRYDTNTDLLNRTDWYYLMYGGIDNREVLNRDRDPSPISAAIARRMASQMACLTVPQEFSYVDPADRRLFRLVDLDTTVATDPDAIREQMQYLYLALYGELLDLYDSEISALVDLFDAIQGPYGSYLACSAVIVQIYTAWLADNNIVETCLVDDKGYERATITLATAEDLEDCFSNIAATFSQADIQGDETPYEASQRMLFTYHLVQNEVSVPPDLTDLVSFMTHLSVQCQAEGMRPTQGEGLPAACYARTDFYEGFDLGTADGRRQITLTTDASFTVRTWQAILMVMLSDFEYLYE